MVQDQNELLMCNVVDKDRTSAYEMISRDLSNTALPGTIRYEVAGGTIERKEIATLLG